jgi:hypothetical protein
MKVRKKKRVLIGRLNSYVDINHKHQIYRSKAIENRQAVLRDYYRKLDLNFCDEDICEEQRLKWRLLGILPVNWIPELIGGGIKVRRRVISTWSYRQLVPIGIIFIWILIYAYPQVCR